MKMPGDTFTPATRFTIAGAALDRFYATRNFSWLSARTATPTSKPTEPMQRTEAGIFLVTPRLGQNIRGNMGKNRGKEFEHRLEKINRLYSMQGVAKIEKVDPPSLVIKGRMIMKSNPFLDFIGHWTEVGTTIIMEAKFTETPRLSFLHQGGLSEVQYGNLWAWSDAGAAVGLLWCYADPEMKNEVRMVTLPMMAERIQANVKSIKWDEAIPIRRQRTPLDYLAELHVALWKKELASLTALRDSLHQA